MKMKKFLILLFLFAIPSAHALTVEPASFLTGCPYNLTEMVWYDVCLTPVEDAVVYYNISFGIVDPSTVSYPSIQTLDNLGGGLYSKTLTCRPLTGNPPKCLWINGTYTASVNVTRKDYENVYDSGAFTVLPDYPYPFNFSYSALLDYFNIWWKGKYQDGSCFPDRKFRVECYLNDRFENPGLPYPAERIGGEEGVSSVVNPFYNLTKDTSFPAYVGASVLNKVACKFYDTAHPWLSSWRNETFRPIHFELTILPHITATVGKEFSFPLSIKNNGLLTDNYTILVIPQINSYAVSIIFGNTTLKNIKKGQTAESYVKLMSLTTDTATINITAISGISGISASQTITLKGGMVSLDEFGLIGIFQILLITSMIFAFAILKKK